MGQGMSLRFRQCGRMVRACLSSLAFFYFEATKDTCSASPPFYATSANVSRKLRRYVARWRRCGSNLKKEYDDAGSRAIEKYKTTRSRRNHEPTRVVLYFSIALEPAS